MEDDPRCILARPLDLEVVVDIIVRDCDTIAAARRSKVHFGQALSMQVFDAEQPNLHPQTYPHLEKDPTEPRPNQRCIYGIFFKTESKSSCPYPDPASLLRT